MVTSSGKGLAKHYDKLMLVRGFLRANRVLALHVSSKWTPNVRLNLMYPIASVVSLDSTQTSAPGLLLTDDRESPLAKDFNFPSPGPDRRRLELISARNLQETPAGKMFLPFQRSVGDKSKIMKHNAHSEAMPVETQVAELCSAQSLLRMLNKSSLNFNSFYRRSKKILEDSERTSDPPRKAIKRETKGKTITEAERNHKDSREELTRIHDESQKLHQNL
nr:hypothetical protein Iba_chr12cCG13270 [Ipomoea batatas]